MGIFAAIAALEGVSKAVEPSSQGSHTIPDLAALGITGGLAADSAPVQNLPGGAGRGASLPDLA